MSETQQETVATPLLELASARDFFLNGKNGKYKITCRRVTAEDWAAYFAEIYVTTQQEGKAVRKSVDIDSARLLLASRVITCAEGYKVQGDADIMSYPDWQSLLPVSHRLMVASLLAGASPSSSEEDNDLIYPHGRPVHINAPWSSDEKGGLQIFSGLTHVLKAPTEAQYRRYSRASSQSIVLGGSRAGTTQYPSSHLVAAGLYDELVVSVSGYAIGGQPLTDVETIKREMDTHHKFMAAIQVLQPKSDAPKTQNTAEGDDAE